MIRLCAAFWEEAVFYFKNIWENIWWYGFNTYFYRMENELKRKEVWLHPTVLDKLQLLASKKKWSLKQYMETVLINDSNKADKK